MASVQRGHMVIVSVYIFVAQCHAEVKRGMTDLLPSIARAACAALPADVEIICQQRFTINSILIIYSHSTHVRRLLISWARSSWDARIRLLYASISSSFISAVRRGSEDHYRDLSSPRASGSVRIQSNSGYQCKPPFSSSISKLFDVLKNDGPSFLVKLHSLYVNSQAGARTSSACCCDSPQPNRYFGRVQPAEL